MDRTFSYSKVYVICGLLSVLVLLIMVISFVKEGDNLLALLFFLCFCLFLWGSYRTALKIIINDDGIRQAFYNHDRVSIDWNKINGIFVKKLPNYFDLKSRYYNSYLVEGIKNNQIKKIRFHEKINGAKELLDLINKYAKINNIKLVAVDKDVETPLNQITLYDND